MRRILTPVSLLFVLFFCLAALATPAFAQTPPSAVQAQTQGTGQITVTWAAVAGASGYDIYQGTASGTYTASTSVNATITHLTVSSLNDNTTYYFMVETVASGKTGAASQEVSARSGAAQLAAPTGLTATPASGQVALAWNSVPGATAYDIFRTPDASGNNDGILVSALAATTYTDTAVANGTTYKYQVAAVCPAGTGVQAGAVPATPLSPPALAAEATANQSGTEIDLSWTASAGAASYTLYRSTTSGGETSYRTGLTGTSYADTGLPTSTTYYYTLVAVAGGSSSAPSGEVSARTGSALLAAPVLTVHPQDAQATLSWPSVSGASYYDVYRATGSGTPSFYTRVSSGTGYTDVDLTDGTTYTYEVASGSANGQGSLSNSVSVTPLAIPTLSARASSPGEIDLSWTSAAGATGYTLDQSTGGSNGPWTQIASPSGTTYSDTGLSPGTNYWFRLQAVSGNGNSGSSDTVLAETFPATPTGLTATAGNGLVQLSWTAPSGDVGSYSLYRGTSAGGESGIALATGITGTAYTDSTAVNGTTYYYAVTAVDFGGEGPKSNEASARPLYSPPTVAAAASASPPYLLKGGGVGLSLSALGASPGGEGALTYTWSATGPAAVTFDDNGSNSASDTDGALTQAGTYTFTVVIADPYGRSVSSSVTVTLAQTPTVVTVTPNSASVMPGGSQPFSAAVTDQFGNPVSGASAAWALRSGVGSIGAASGTYSAGMTPGSAVVTATSGDAVGTALVTVTSTPPTVTTQAAAGTPFAAAGGEGVALSVLGASANGEGTLTYTWSETLNGVAALGMISPNGTNAAKSATATLTQAGSYTFTATITDAYGASVSSSVTVVAIQTPTTVTVTPATASVTTSGTQQFGASVTDQFGTAMTGQTITWSVTSGTGTISSSGLYTAPATAETDTVQAACGGVSGTASVTVTAPAAGPYVVTAASASPSPVTGTTTTLSVVASDTLGNAPLTYTWALTGTPPAPVDYSDNADATAQTTTVTFGQAGTYVFAVTITDSMGLSATSTVTVVVDQVASFVLLSPINVQLSDGATQQFTASDVDQFGNAMPTQPSSFTWAVTDGTGTVTQTGLYTAPHQTAYSVAVNETDVVQASDGSISGDAEVGVRGLPGLLLAPTPAPPTGLTATAGNKQITLTWNDSGASYNIYRSYSSGGEGPTPIANVGAGNGTTVTYTDTGLTNNQIYYYTVTAVVGGSESAFSGEASATPVNPLPTITVPVAASPTYVTGTTVVLSVTATDDTPGITYTWIPIGFAPVTFSDNGDTTASTTTATFTGAGTYTFTVYATDADDATVISTVTVTVAQTLTAISVLTPSPPSPVTGGGTYFFQTGGTDQFGNAMPPSGAAYTVTSGSGTVSASSDPPGVLFQAPGGIASPETDTITMSDGGFTKTINVAVTPDDTGGHWGTYQDAQQYQPVVTAKGTDAVTDPLGGGMGEDWWQPSGFEGVEYIGAGATSTQGCSVDVSGTFTYVFTWVPDTAASVPPGSCYLNVSAAARAFLAGNTFTVADGFGDPAEISNGNPASSGTRIVRVKASSGTATFTTPQIQSQASEPPGGGSVFCSATVEAPVVPPPSVAVASPANNAIVAAGTDVVVTVSADLNFLSGGTSATALQSVTLAVTGGSGSGGMMAAVADEPGTFALDLGPQMAGVLTLTAQAQYGDGGGGTVEVDSQPSTFYAASFSATGGSWTPNPNCVEEISSGQAQAALDPGSIDGGGSGPFFVIYDWTTQNVYYSQDGTSGAFEPYGGNSIIEWQQGQANTTFKAQCFDVGFYILEAQCVATVYSQYTGAVVTSFTQTCYIGGSAGDIDMSGGNSGHAKKAHQQTAHQLTAHDGGGGTGHQEAPVTVTFNPDSLIKLGLGAPKGNKTTITATVSPADQAGTVMFRSTNSDFITTNGEVTIQYTNPDASGKVTIYVTAASGTPGLPGNTGSPDCYVIASSGSPGTAPLATVPVLVLKPTGCSESPASSTQDSVTNKVWFPNQPPDPDWRLGTPPYGQAYFATLVRKDITITIYDQFNKPLDAMYDGRYVVNENITGGLTDPRSGPIQFTTGLLASGVIIDEVALPDVVSDDTDDPNLKSSQALWLNNQPTFPINPPHGALVYDNAFVADTPHYPKKRSGTGNQALSVYGYSLSPSWDRGITINPTESVNAIMTVTETPGK